MSTDDTPDTGARFTFYPAVRSGYRPISDDDTAVELTVVGDGEDDGTTEESVSMPIHLYGPADVTAIDGRQISRREPTPETEDHEPPQFPSIEFSRPDFPWLFSPEARGDHGRLRPWLILAVVDRDDPDVGFEPVGPGECPVLEAPIRELPDPAESWAWAHAQQTGVDDDSDDIPAIEIRSAHSRSRIVAPRHLDAKTRYRACLVPTFERGRLVGLDRDPDETDADRTAVWGSSLSASDTIRLPVYDSWTFITSTEGDFATLARDLEPTTFGADIGVRTIDVSKPGPRSLKRPETDERSTVGLEGALLSPAFVTEKRDEGLDDDFDPDSANTLESLLTGAEALDEAIDEGIVSPPLYGRWHANRSSFGPDDWFDQLNLDPRYRICAGFGATVVQSDQESLMASAWEQFGDLDLINDYLRRCQLSKEAQESIFATVESMRIGRKLQFARPCLPNVIVDHRQLTAMERLTELEAPLGMLETTFRSLSSPTAALARRDGVAITRLGVDAHIEHQTVVPRDTISETFTPLEDERVHGGGYDTDPTGGYDTDPTGGYDIDPTGGFGPGFEEFVPEAHDETTTGGPRFWHAMAKNVVDESSTVDDEDDGDTDSSAVADTIVGVIDESGADSDETPFELLSYDESNDADGGIDDGSEADESKTGVESVATPLSEPDDGSAERWTIDPIVAIDRGERALAMSVAPESKADAGVKSRRGERSPGANWTAAGRDGQSSDDDTRGVRGPADESPDKRAARKRVLGFLESVKRYCRSARTAVLSLEVTVTEASDEPALRAAIDTELAEITARCERIVPHAVEPLSIALSKVLAEPRPQTVDEALTQDGIDSELDRLRTIAGELIETLEAIPDAHEVSVKDAPDIVNALVRSSRDLSRILEIIAGLHDRIPSEDERGSDRQADYPTDEGGDSTDRTGDDRRADEDSVGDEESVDTDILQSQSTTRQLTAIESASDLEAIAAAVTAEIDPAERIPQLIASRTPLSVADVRDTTGNILVDRIMPSPTFDWPMYGELAAIDERYLLPGIGEIERDAVGLLQTNDPFIQSFMGGLNHEMARLLRWRRYPTDRRGTYFREFWDHTADPYTDNTDVEGKADIEKLHRWTGDLGTDVIGEASMVLLIRGDLFRRYPNTVVYAAKATGSKAECDRRPDTPKGSIEDADVGEKSIEFPSFRGSLGDDVEFFGFDLSLEEVHDGEGWFFVLEEAPAEHRFGLVGDVYDEEEPEVDPGEYVSVEAMPEWIESRLEAIEDEVAGDDDVDLDDIESLSGVDEGPLRYAVWKPGPTRQHEWADERNSAHVANVTYRMPTRIAIHASQMLPDPTDEAVTDGGSDGGGDSDA